MFCVAVCLSTISEDMSSADGQVNVNTELCSHTESSCINFNECSVCCSFGTESSYIYEKYPCDHMYVCGVHIVLCHVHPL